MPSTIRVRATAGNDGVEVQALIRHPMESGFIKDDKGQIIPAHYIQVVTFEAEGRNVFTAFWGPAVSKDPYLKFAYKDGRKGDTLKIAWIDNEGQSDSLTATVQ
jgi:sulfur-oxidizing protein SoxZ